LILRLVLCTSCEERPQLIPSCTSCEERNYWDYRPTDRAYTPTIHRPYDSADTPAIYDLSLASYCYDNDCTTLPTVRPTIVPLCLRSTRQPINELCARPLSLPPLVPYYYPNRPLLLLPAAYLIRHSLLLPAVRQPTIAATPAANLNSTSAAPTCSIPLTLAASPAAITITVQEVKDKA